MLVFAILAIALSAFFFYMSWQSSNRIADSANKIDKNVDKLQVLFSQQYDRAMGWLDKFFDTSLGVMGKSDNATEAEIDEKVEIIKGELSSEIAEVVKKQKDTNGELVSLTTELKPLIDRAISQTREVDSDVKEESFIRNVIVGKLLVAHRGGVDRVSVNLLFRSLPDIIITFDEFKALLYKMRSEGLIELVEAVDEVGIMRPIKVWVKGTSGSHY